MRKNVAADAEAPRPLTRKPVILSRQQSSELIAVSRQDPRGLLVELLLKTGLRVDSEALNLRWQEVGLDARRLSVRDLKTRAGQGRIIPLDPDLARLLRHLFGGQVNWVLTDSPLGLWRSVNAKL